MPESIAVSVKNVSKQFDNVEVLRDINRVGKIHTAALYELAGTAGPR